MEMTWLFDDEGTSSAEERSESSDVSSTVVMSAGGLAAPDITTKHVIVVLWFEVAVLCSKLLLYIVSGGSGLVERAVWGIVRIRNMGASQETPVQWCSGAWRMGIHLIHAPNFFKGKG